MSRPIRLIFCDPKRAFLRMPREERPAFARFLNRILGVTPAAPAPSAEIEDMQEKRIMARFTPQAWIRDYATDIDGAYDFDVTAHILAMPKDKALALTDNSDAADNLWLNHPISGERPHAGPFRVSVQDEIASYFEVTP